jgi:xanthine dehydrogenase accessory factor
MRFDDPVFGPIEFIVDAARDCALAVIVETTGPSYRQVGAMMAITASGETSASLSSGCIEADIVSNARHSIECGVAKLVRYGSGSPIIDLRLPCGGAMEVLIIPSPDKNLLRDILDGIARRVPQTLAVGKTDGRLSVVDPDDTAIATGTMQIALRPKIAFRIFGSGTETLHFAALAVSLGFQITVHSPTPELIEHLSSLNIAGTLLKSTANIVPPPIDHWTAAILFFHDHDWEPPILKLLLDTDAFFIGAQGSNLARSGRDTALQEMGAAPENIARICGPIGLIPATRDPRTLAVSVMAQIMALVQERFS